MKITCIQMIYLLGISLLAVKAKHPNVVLVVTDDQDLVIGGLIPMVKTQLVIANKGITFSNAFVTTPICCPSRSSLLTGKYTHNHGTLNNSISGGCYNETWRHYAESRSFATYLHDAGYTTFYAGKYLNQYGHGEKKIIKAPPGWDWWLGLVGNSRYYNYTLSVNGTAKHFSDDYLTDVIKSYGLEFLRGKQRSDNSFLMVIAPPAPHAPFTAAPQYQDHFKNITVFKSANFNTEVGRDKHWLLRLNPNPLPNTFIPELDSVYRRRWETLLSVDDLVDSIVNQLDLAGLLNDTFVMVTSDHGYHIGQFGLPWDKRQPYESDIRVPFLIRGPGVPEKRVIDVPVLNIDIAPTLLDMAGIPVPDTMDGSSFLPLIQQPTRGNSGRAFLVEYYGEGSANTVSHLCGYVEEDTLAECGLDNLCKCQDATNNTYSCIRRLDPVDDILYCQFHDSEGFVEFYDLKSDPYQLRNIASSENTAKLKSYNLMLNRFKQCSGVSCRELSQG